MGNWPTKPTMARFPSTRRPIAINWPGLFLLGTLGGCNGEGTQVDSSVDGSPSTQGNADMKNDLVAPVGKGTTYSFTSGETVFAVDAAKGGRIVTFALGGRNMLTPAKDGQDNNWGSTFWPSPQSDWNWPPPSAIDPGAYTANLDGNTLSLTGATSAALELAATKTFQVASDTGTVTIVYGLVNRGQQARSVAPWEITRVAASGLTFFPMGEGSPSKGSQDLLNLQMVDGVAWFPYDAKAIANEQKVFADGHEGWIAHVDGNLLLVKAFSDTTPAQAAPGESEIEIYTDGAHTYIEVENQGAYVTLAPGASLQWTVRWFLRKLDGSLSVQVGSSDLLNVVRSLVKG